METASRRRTSWAVLASAIAHLAVLTVLVLQKPMLAVPVEPGGPPPAIIPLLLMPRVPPPTAGRKARPEPIRLHRRPQRFVPPDVTPAPIAPPAPPPAAPPAPRAPIAIHPAPQPKGPEGDVRTALRQGPVGCANPLAVGLNKAERELCDEKFGKGAKDATPYATGLEMTAAKKALLDRAASERERDYNYKRTTPSATVPPSGPGASAEQMCKDLGISAEECGTHSRR